MTLICNSDDVFLIVVGWEYLAEMLHLRLIYDLFK